MSLLRFSATTVAAFIAYGVLYVIGVEIFADKYGSMMAFMVPEDQIAMASLAYHLVQTIIVVWLFDKAVGSSDLKDGAVFGAMIGLYLMASDSIWFISIKDLPQDARLVQGLMSVVIGALVGVLLAKLYSIGRGEDSADEA
ncbi:MAG: hypothetical protein KUG56_03130 [Kordiimonadaceae bacterium]|nr:hypothetical protein [Kordiimonadaceae bacterium]